MADRVILHVGPNKTGTTALQHAFVANTSTLARCNIAYPMAGRVIEAHHGLVSACRDSDMGLLHDLSDEIRWEETVLMSSEGFSGLQVPALTRLKTALGNARIEVVYMIRRLADLWPSHWKEMVKHGLHLPFSEYMAQPPETDRMAFRAPPMPTDQLSALAEVFGRSQLRIAVFDARNAEPRAFGQGFARDILRVGDHAKSFTTADRNRTPAEWQIEILRLVNSRAEGRIDAAGKRRLASKALRLLDTEPPGWAAAFRALIANAEITTLSSDTPSVAAEQAAVLRQFGDLLIDPAASFKAHAETAVRNIDGSCLGAALDAELDSFFDRLVQPDLSSY